MSKPFTSTALAVLMAMVAMALVAAKDTRLLANAPVCSEATTQHKTTALILQGFLGFVGAGSLYTGHAALAVASLAVLALFVFTVALRMMMFGTKDKTPEEMELIRKTMTPEQVEEQISSAQAIARILTRTAIVLTGILWLVGEVAIATDTMKPTNGCGWANVPKS